MKMLLALLFATVCIAAWHAPDLSRAEFAPSQLDVDLHPEVTHWGTVIRAEDGDIYLDKWRFSGSSRYGTYCIPKNPANILCIGPGPSLMGIDPASKDISLGSITVSGWWYAGLGNTDGVSGR